MAKSRNGAWRLAAYTFIGVVSLAGLLFGWHQGDQYLISSPRFVISTIEDDAASQVHLDGVQYGPRDQIYGVFQPDSGRSVYLMPLAERRRQLLAVDWVRDASVARIWPDQVSVHVTERKPVAFVRSGSASSGTEMIDSEGVLLELRDTAKFQLPVVTGIRRDQTEAERRQRIQRMIRLESEIGRYIERISEIDLGDPDNIKIVYPLEDRAMILHLGHSRYAVRLRRFLENLDEIVRRLPNARKLDLRLEDRIIAVPEGSDAR